MRRSFIKSELIFNNENIAFFFLIFEFISIIQVALDSRIRIGYKSESILLEIIEILLFSSINDWCLSNFLMCSFLVSSSYINVISEYNDKFNCWLELRAGLKNTKRYNLNFVFYYKCGIFNLGFFNLKQSTQIVQLNLTTTSITLIVEQSHDLRRYSIWQFSKSSNEDLYFK